MTLILDVGLETYSVTQQQWITAYWNIVDGVWLGYTLFLKLGVNQNVIVVPKSPYTPFIFWWRSSKLSMHLIDNGMFVV